MVGTLVDVAIHNISNNYTVRKQVNLSIAK